VQHEERRLDPVLAMGLAAAMGPPLVLAPLVSVVVLSLALAIAWPLVSPKSAAVLVPLALVAAIRTHGALERADSAHCEVAAQLARPQRCEVRARWARSPVVVGSRNTPSEVALGRARVDADVLDGACELGPAPRTRIRLYDGPEESARGDVFELVIDLAAVQRFDNPGLTDPRLSLEASGVTASGKAIVANLVERGEGLRATIDRARAHVRRRIERTMPEDVAPLARALVLGETDLTEADRTAFQTSGLSHLLAVSGTHLVLAVMALVRLLGAALVRFDWLSRRCDARRIAAALGVPLAVVYADFAGGSGSAWRAAAMLGCALLARALGRRPIAVRSLALALLGPVFFDPLVATDTSFLLSLAATSALMLTHERTGSARAQGPASLLLATMRSTLAATVATAPILLLLGARLPVHGVAANVLAAPIGELVALPASLLHACLAWSPPLERTAAALSAGALRAVREVAHAAAGAPWSSCSLPPPTPLELGIFGLATLAAFRWPRERARLGGVTLGFLLAAELHARHEGAPTEGLRITALDVGQGDSLLVDLPDGRAMLIDGGGMVGSGIDLGRRVLLPELAARRKSRIDIVVVTHPHPDHFLGLVTALPELEVGEVWESGLGPASEPNGALARMVQDLAQRGTVVRTARELCQARREFGGAEVTVLSPCPSFQLLDSANDNSLVLRLRLGTRAALLVGDAERQTETELVQRHGSELRADLLKVGHHGSRTSSTPAFLEAVAPEFAFISSGVRNRFGHPAPTTLASLSARRARVSRTDQEGALTYWTDGTDARVTTTRATRRAWPWNSR